MIEREHGTEQAPAPSAPAAAPRQAIASGASRILGLQRQAGNRATAALLRKETPGAKPNNTGMPDNLKSGVEALSGMDMSDVKVHYNSSKPAEVQAVAFTMGNEIHIGPGQEQHLPHEAWHVVQQRQGRVASTPAMAMQQVNDNPALEKEADRMGARAEAASPPPE